MGCGCNKGTSASQLAYKFTAPDGKVTTFNTEVEARAAKIKAGGGHYTPVPK